MPLYTAVLNSLRKAQVKELVSGEWGDGPVHCAIGTYLYDIGINPNYYEDPANIYPLLPASLRADMDLHEFIAQAERIFIANDSGVDPYLQDIPLPLSDSEIRKMRYDYMIAWFTGI